MKSIAFVVAGALLTSSAEAGGVVTWTDPVTGARIVGRTTSPCAEVATGGALAVRCTDDAALSPGELGPGGGVLLARSGDRFIEGDLASGAIQMIVVDASGAVAKREPLLRDIKVLRRFQRRTDVRTLISARIENVPAVRGVIDGTGVGDREVISFNILTYTVNRGVKTVVDESDVAYDLATLRPTVSPRGLLAYTANRETIQTTAYWISYWH